MIHYNFASIAQASDDINRTNGNIDRILGDLKSQLQPLVAEWEGESAESYNAAQAKWDKSAAELNQILAQVAVAVRQANDRMSDINNSAARSWA